MQFRAGYIVDAIAKVITKYKTELNDKEIADKSKLNQINGLLQHVSSFDVEFPNEHNPNFKELNPVLASLNNIITRGLPTRAPIILENIFSEIDLIRENDDEYELNYPQLTNNVPHEVIIQLLHIVEPGLDINRSNHGGNLGSEGEWLFLDKDLIEYPYAKQILQSQRLFVTIDKKLGGGRSIDFSYEFPYIHFQGINLQKKGVIFEYDGSHHKINSYKYYDSYRDDSAEENNFETLRQPSDMVELNQSITNQFKKEIFQIFKMNFEINIDERLAEYSLIFIPFAVARIQKTIIEYFITHPDIFTQEDIIIAIIERDLPCGAIAIESLKELFFNINAILEDKDKLILPKITLTIFENKKWVFNDKLHLNAAKGDEIYFKLNNFDIVIDHSILRRSNIYKEIDFQTDNAIKIRSSHYVDNSFGNARRVYCGDLLHYKTLVEKQSDGSYRSIEEFNEPINYFIQNIFRKIAFREGQLPIISRALQQKPVIGLLPTGGGKSLTFQLLAFLQPGLCLVVDPIKSLMEDQVRVLKENWIDCCDFINSNLNREQKVKKLTDFRYGETMFLYVSPERFVMEDFRSIIQRIDVSKFGLTFSYCVIDEVHCVSEWGHDFRSTYLMLGKNAQLYCSVRNSKFEERRADKKDKSDEIVKKVSLIGLTATASFDVLADIERELQIKHNDVAEAIIMIENTIRPELFFRVIDVTGKDRMQEMNRDFSSLGFNLNKINDEAILMASQKHHFKEFEKRDFASAETKDNLDTNTLQFEYNPKYLLNEKLNDKTENDFCVIIFCPTKGNIYGVDTVYNALKSESKGFFYATEIDDLNEEVQAHFKNFTTDKTKHIICTKAFGMGIDKKDIRTTYHFVYSGSLESLVQESGRSGRDKKISEANILVSQSKSFKVDVHKLFKANINHPLIKNKNTRKAIRNSFEVKFENINGRVMPIEIAFPIIEDLYKILDSIDFSLTTQNNERYNILGKEDIVELKILLKSYDKDGFHSYIVERYLDRDVHDYFYKLSFKGVDTEKSQLLNLFKVQEFQLIDNERKIIEKQNTLSFEFNNCKENTFDFIITAVKKHEKPESKIIEILSLTYTEGLAQKITNTFEHSQGFDDFLFLLEEKNVKELKTISDDIKKKLLFVYSRDRNSSNDTGRLIYRMHSMGLLEDYTIDFKMNNLYRCTFKKAASIDYYVEKIDLYFRRYLSETSALKKINELRKKLQKQNLVDDVLVCVEFLSEFSYEEIAEKRRRATKEIQDILIESITNTKYIGTNNWFEQNKFIKEQIYFYFNAKYARLDFKINGQSFSLLKDYRDNANKKENLKKYLNVFGLEGVEQNNYKHMIGSCKKILRSLAEDDLKKEWLLYLLKAFSMYSVNNESYISEANEDLEKGFTILYNSGNTIDFSTIQPILDVYFDALLKNIDKIQNNTHVLENIELIQAKILLQFQNIKIESFYNKHLELKAKYQHA